MGYGPLVTAIQTDVTTALANLTTLLSRLSSTRAALLDNIAASVMPTAAAVAALPTSLVVGVQTISWTMGPGTTSQNVTVTAVTLAKSFISKSGDVNDNATPGASAGTYVFMSSTTNVSCSRNGGTGTDSGYAYLVEFI